LIQILQKPNLLLHCQSGEKTPVFANVVISTENLNSLELALAEGSKALQG